MLFNIGLSGLFLYENQSTFAKLTTVKEVFISIMYSI